MKLRQRMLQFRTGTGDKGHEQHDIANGVVSTESRVVPDPEGVASIPDQQVLLFVMNPESLALELNREPFLPLRLRLADGRSVDVLNPGLCFIARLSLYFFAAKPHDALAEDVQVISLRHIVSVETIAPQQAA